MEVDPVTRIVVVDLARQFALESFVLRGLLRDQKRDQLALFHRFQMGRLVFELRQGHKENLC